MTVMLRRLLPSLAFLLVCRGAPGFPERPLGRAGHDWLDSTVWSARSTRAVQPSLAKVAVAISRKS